MSAKANLKNYLAKHSCWSAELNQLRSLLLATKLEETVKWGAPVYCLENKNIVGLAAFKSYVGLWFFQGAFINDRLNVLINAQAGKTKAMRQWRFQSINEIDVAVVTEYIQMAIANQKAGKQVSPARTTTVLVPIELQQAMQIDQDLEQAFKRLTLSKQREFAEYITEAKRENTRQSRLKKIKPMIIQGIGLYDKYRNT